MTEDLKRELEHLSITISTDNDGAFWGNSPGDHLGNVAGYIGKIESQLDAARTRQRALKNVLLAVEPMLRLAAEAGMRNAEGINLPLEAADLIAFELREPK